MQTPPIDLVRAWILNQGTPGSDISLDDSTRFLEEGYLDSIGFLGLIVFIESLLGSCLTEAQMSAANFVSLQTIEQTFFSNDVL